MCRCFLAFFRDILSALNSFSPLLPPMLPLAAPSIPLSPPCPWWVSPAPRNQGWQALLWLEGLSLAAAQEPGWCNLGALQAPDSLQRGNHIPPGDLNWSSLTPRLFSCLSHPFLGVKIQRRGRALRKGPGLQMDTVSPLRGICHLLYLGKAIWIFFSAWVVFFWHDSVVTDFAQNKDSLQACIPLPEECDSLEISLHPLWCSPHLWFHLEPFLVLFHPKTCYWLWEVDLCILGQILLPCSVWASVGQVAQIPAGHIQVLHFVESSHDRRALKGTVMGIYSDFLCLAHTSSALLQALSLWLVGDTGLYPRSVEETCLCD